MKLIGGYPPALCGFLLLHDCKAVLEPLSRNTGFSKTTLKHWFQGCFLLFSMYVQYTYVYIKTPSAHTLKETARRGFFEKNVKCFCWDSFPAFSTDCSVPAAASSWCPCSNDCICRPCKAHATSVCHHPAAQRRQHGWPICSTVFPSTAESCCG